MKFDRRNLLDAKMEHEHEKICWWKFKTLIFMVWDGAAAFNNNEVKLKRIAGRQPGWCDKCRTKDTIYTLILSIMIYGWVIQYEFIKFCSEKSIRY
jgi:hypothetical protein